MRSLKTLLSLLLTLCLLFSFCGVTAFADGEDDATGQDAGTIGGVWVNENSVGLSVEVNGAPVTDADPVTVHRTDTLTTVAIDADIDAGNDWSGGGFSKEMKEKTTKTELSVDFVSVK